MNKIKVLFRLMSDNSGATAIEYGLIAALISVAALASFQSVGSTLSENFQATAEALKQ